MNPDEIVVSVSGVSKDFRLPDEKLSSLKSHLVHPLKHREYKVQHALRDISVDIKKGEFFGIVGRNGSGKSTLLKIIAGIYQPTKGKVSIKGKLVPFIELGVGFNPELTGRENVYLNGALLGFNNKEIDAMYDNIVSFAELQKFMNQKLKNYSSGMQVRLAFSMAVRARADVLLIDEVLAVGDADFQRKCFDYFNHLKKEGTTVIFVSHDMAAVRKYCDRAMLIENSRVVDLGQTDAIAQEYLKLFTEKDSDEPDTHDKTGNRWGNSDIVTSHIKAIVEADQITIEQQLQVNKPLEQPIIGFRIRNDEGTEMTGTNTLIEKITVPEAVKGKTIRLTWRFENMLPEGKYTIDPAVLYNDGVTVADWWNGAAHFRVEHQRKLPYIIQPLFKTNIS